MPGAPMVRPPPPASAERGPVRRLGVSRMQSVQRIVGSIGLPVWILIGAVTGIAAGVVFGERAAVLQPVGSAYAMMLEVAVYPYLLCSLLYGVGRLTPVMARRLFQASWAVYLFMWVVTFIGIWVLARAIPAPPLPSVLTPALAARQASLLNLLIPANLFDALGKNYVPAVVVFAIVYGIAIQKIERKAALFEILQAIQVASVTIWGWIVRLAPVGVFALFAAAAGTVQPDRMGGLLLYVSLFLIGTLLLAFVVLPAVLSAVAPVGYREVLAELRPAFVLALVTTLSVVALPFVLKAAERVAAQAGCPEGDERTDVIQASLSISYVLAQLGNYFLYLLMLFAAFVHQLRLTPTEQLLLPFWTLLSGFGSPTATVDGVVFLTSWLRLPASVLNLFLETWTVTRYGQVALSVMGFGFATTLVPLVYFRKLRPHPVRLCGTMLGSGAIFAAVVLAGVAMRPVLLPGP
ncbi:MAG: dicarboxylate/amino acid:cation symporter, partial [Stellaceae bacterium]